MTNDNDPQGAPEGAPAVPENPTPEPTQPQPAPVIPEPQPYHPDYLPGPELDLKKENGWIKFLRVLIWLGVITLISLGLGLRGASTKLSAFSDGSASALLDNGNALLTLGLILGSLNLLWGAIRWFLRWKRQKWTAGKVIGKLIGGGLWRTLVIAPLAFGILVLGSPVLARSISEKVSADLAAETETSSTKLAAAFAAGEITADQYITYLLDAAYAAENLPDSYRAGAKLLAADLFTELEAHAEELSNDTVLKVLQATGLNNVEFDTEASGNSSKVDKPLFGDNAYAESGRVTTLNKATLSSSAHFIVFYTNQGSNAISAADATRIAEMMENLISRYESEFGLKYHTEQLTFSSGFFNSKRSGVEKVMQANDIDKSHLNTAMPIYVVNPYSTESNVLASYVGRKWLNFAENFALKFSSTLGAVLDDGKNQETIDVSQFYLSSPTLPFINILPENASDPSLELVVAHEFGHHYASNYCYDTFGAKCASEANFIDETFPNYAASMVVQTHPEDNLLSHHATGYVKNPTKPLYDDSYNGYKTLGFLYHYANLVDGGKTKILNALNEPDAYWYLYSQAGGKMPEVLSALAIANLTNDYGSKHSFKSSLRPAGETLPCYDMCSVKYDGPGSSYSWKSSSLHYFYFPLSEFKDKVASVSSLDYSGNYSFRVLGLKGDTWEDLTSKTVAEKDTSGTRHQVTFSDYPDYANLIFIIIDHEHSDDSGKGVYLNILDSELASDVEDPETEEGIDPETNPGVTPAFFGTYGNCLWFYTDGLLDAASEFVGIFSGLDTSLDAAISEWQAEAAAAKSEVGHRKVTLCGVYLNKDTDFDKVKNRPVARGFNLTAFDLADSSSRVAVVVGYNPLSGVATARLLSKDSAGFSLVTATIE